ncbi:MAG TPA: cytochrome c3 family protein, partial [Acidobacteriota bacterium]|nr:cytochrome c3 family protein [Acidobacteriota bacterium]
GRLTAGIELADIEREFQKTFHHPVKEGSGHSPGERLPSLKTATVGHAECVDCHNPHQRIEAGRPQTYAVTGYSLSGQYLESSIYEYQICLKCHSEYLGADRSVKSLSADFDQSVRSQHPVTRGARGVRLPSLAAGSGRSLTMTCSDCHTSDDREGPRGPHGSDHRFLLSGNYTRDIVTDESPYTYEFCYSCHDRSSILSNESFPLHREHIVGDPISGRSGTSCHTCHASHGSRDNPHLLDFNPKGVERDSRTGLLRYEERGEHGGACYLRCHDHDHGPAEY